MSALEVSCPMEDCAGRFSSERQLSEHMYARHQEVAAPVYAFTCPECSAPFQTNVGVEVHCLEAHGLTYDAGPMPTGEAACRHCDGHFRSAHALNMHSRAVHRDPGQGARRNPNMAGQSLEANMARALRARGETSMPSGAEEFTCPECGQGFTRHNGLTRHMNQSHGDAAPKSAPAPERPLRSVPVESRSRLPSRFGAATKVKVAITRDQARVLAALVLEHGIPLAPGAPASIQQARDRAAALELWAALQEAAES